MRVTVAVCTWNRCDLLRQMLERMQCLSIPENVEWELIVVNNNCTDATNEVISRFQNRLPIIRLLEPRPGKSRACNMAVQHATGDYILWTDDDVRVDPDWLREYCAAFRSWPEATFFGGPIYPLFAGEAPAWLEAAFPAVASAYAALDLGEEPLALTSCADDAAPYGANMAIRRDAHVKVPFDEKIGPQPGKTIRGEETKLIQSLLADGATGRWVPAARVMHLIPKHRQTVRYLRDYYGGYGRYLAKSRPDDGRPKFFGRPRWLWKETAMLELRYRWRRIFANPEQWIEDLIQASISLGRLRDKSSEA